MNEEINILIKDNGVGLPFEIMKTGNGLSNMKNRIENLGGSLQFETDNGLAIKINLPKPK